MYEITSIKCMEYVYKIYKNINIIYINTYMKICKYINVPKVYKLYSSFKPFKMSEKKLGILKLEIYEWIFQKLEIYE